MAPPRAAGTVALVALVARHALAQPVAPAPPAPASSPVPATTPATPTPQPAPPAQLPAVEVTGKAGRDERVESTTTKIVVNHDELVRYGDTALSDVLKRLPGITVSGNRILMRGLGAGYTQILLDGEPAPAGFSLETLSPDLIERIEILRAPTADRSTQSIAGTINIVLRKKVSKRVRTLKLGTQSYGNRLAGSVEAQLADVAGSVSYGIGVAARRFIVDDDAVEEQVVRDAAGNVTTRWITRQVSGGNVDSVTLTPRVTWSGAADTLAADLFLRQSRWRSRGDERTQTDAGAPPAFASDTLDFVRDDTGARVRLDWKHRYDNGASIDAKAGLDYARRHSDGTFRAFDAVDVFLLDRSVVGGVRDLGGVSNGKYLLPVLGGHVIALGWDVAVSDRTEFRRQHDFSPVGLVPLDLDEDYDAKVRRLAGFAQDEWDITPRWSAYVGVRWEGLDTRVSGNVIDTVHNRSSVVSPILQTLWKLPGTEHDQVRLALSRTYKAPTAMQLTPRRYIANNNTVATPDYEGNADLRPELAWGLDLAYEHHWASDGLFSASAFARRIDDVILEQLFLRDGIWITSPANRGVADVRGVEVELRGNLRSWRSQAPDVKLRASVARNWSTLRAVPGPDNRLGQQVPVTASAGFDAVLDRLPLTLGSTFSYAAGGPVRVAADRVQYLAATRTLEAYALWKFDPRTQLRVAVADVLLQHSAWGTTYFDAAGGSTALVHSSTPRPSVRATLEMTL